jgi:hypothetical protein
VPRIDSRSAACFIYADLLTEKRGEGNMCTVGGGPDLGDVETLVAKDYECLDCNNKFQGMGRRPMCPSCKSRNVKAV